MTDSSASISSGAVRSDATSPLGYGREPHLQAAFDEAAEHLRLADGCPSPTRPAERTLVADLALEGGGVKGIGLVGAVLVLSEAGYSFPRVAGTSAGAIAATLVASLTRAGQPMTKLREYLASLSFAKFMPEGRLHRLLDHYGGTPGSVIADLAILTERMGLYSGDYLEEWLGPILHDELGVHTFADLRIDPADDPGMSLAPECRYGLVVHVSDVTRARLVRLPWDYHLYGHVADSEDVVAAVRASMSIPFFFEPVTFEAEPAEVEIPAPDGRVIAQHHGGGSVTWVDGGMLRNFPIHAFDRVDGKPPRWPTIGIKLSALQTDFAPTEAYKSSLGIGIGSLRTLISEWDTYAVEEEAAARTIFVDNAGIATTDFDLTAAQQEALFLNGVRAATDFVIEKAEAGGVPRRGIGSALGGLRDDL